MTNEMLGMYPVQFVEGFNENEEPATGRFLTWEGSGIAIPYTPSMTYGLSRIEIYGAPRNLQPKSEYPLHLRTDHEDGPSRNSIASCKLIVPEGDSEQWLEILMEQVIIVLAQRTYWLSLEEYPLPFSIGLATVGAELGLRTGIDQGWAPSSLGKHKCMLKFYGRIMPASVPMLTKEEPYPARSLRRIERCLMEITNLMKEQKELLTKRGEDQTNNRSRKRYQDKNQ